MQNKSLKNKRYSSIIQMQYESNLNLLKLNPLANKLIEAILIILLFLAIYQLPIFVSQNGHDIGSQASFEYWTLNKLSYGVDIIANIGPLGFLSYPRLYSGFLGYEKLYINILLILLLVYLIVEQSRELPLFAKIIFILFSGWFIREDITLYVLLLLLGKNIIENDNFKNILSTTLVLSILSLTKGTNFFISNIIILIIFTYFILLRKYKNAFLTILSYSIFTLLIWKISGQLIVNFISFIIANFYFAEGYNEAMSSFENPSVRDPALIVLFSIVIFNFYKLIKIRINQKKEIFIKECILILIEFVVLFVVWKHGFVRADSGHVIIFYGYVLVTSVLIFIRTNNETDNLAKDAIVIPLFMKLSIWVLIVVGCNAGVNNFFTTNINGLFIAEYRRIESAIDGLMNIEKLFKKFQNELNISIENMQMTQTKKIVGDSSISYFGMLPAVMLYNDFNYKPLPSTISFAAWNDQMMQTDALLLRDDNNAPLFVLYDLKTIDNRLAAQDGALAQIELYHRYELIHFEKENFILKRLKNKKYLYNSALSSTQYKLNEWVQIPKNNKNPLWVRINFKQSIFTKIISFLYKPPQYYINIEYLNGDEKSFKLITKMAETGFMIDPLITNNFDSLKLFINNNKNMIKVEKFKIICNKLEILCSQEAVVDFELINGLNILNVSANLDK